MQHAEPWLRGPIEGTHPVIAHLFYTFTQAREELAHWTAGLTTEQVWSSHAGLPPLGFHLRHITGSVSRLTAYLEGRQLSEPQLVFLRAEQTPGAALDELLAAVEHQFAETEHAVQRIPLSEFTSPRYVGRKQLPTTVAGLIIHLSEHTQRHLGQAILTAKVLRSGAE